MTARPPRCSRRWTLTTVVAVLGLAVLAPLLSGCSAARYVWGAAFNREATVGDFAIDGVLTRACVPVRVVLDVSGEPGSGGFELENPAAALAGRPVGCLLGLTRVGETLPVFIYCPVGELERQCKAIPANARVRVWGQPFGPPGVWTPSRLQVDG